MSNPIPLITMFIVSYLLSYAISIWDSKSSNQCYPNPLFPFMKLHKGDSNYGVGGWEFTCVKCGHWKDKSGDIC